MIDIYDEKFLFFVYLTRYTLDRDEVIDAVT